MKNFTKLKISFKKLKGKRLLWTSRIKIFCDGGEPIYRLTPRVRRQHYNPHWGLYGFAVYWLGREFNVCVGIDKRGLYTRPDER